MNSFDFRNSELFLRNGFEPSGEYGFPLVRKQVVDLDKVELIAYSDISAKDVSNLHKGVHFFVDDIARISNATNEKICMFDNWSHDFMIIKHACNKHAS